ncbi:hypothetical protein HUJ05_007005 [Dendroctonus ponderosae]|nr:hypothetical protein HUJ05_007005 [Dendroctonus ponderosae]
MAGVLFEDIFNVKDIDPEGKKFDRGKLAGIDWGAHICVVHFVRLEHVVLGRPSGGCFCPEHGLLWVYGGSRFPTTLPVSSPCSTRQVQGHWATPHSLRSPIKQIAKSINLVEFERHMDAVGLFHCRAKACVVHGNLGNGWFRPVPKISMCSLEGALNVNKEARIWVVHWFTSLRSMSITAPLETVGKLRIPSFPPRAPARKIVPPGSPRQINLPSANRRRRRPFICFGSKFDRVLFSLGNLRSSCVFSVAVISQVQENGRGASRESGKNAAASIWAALKRNGENGRKTAGPPRLAASLVNLILSSQGFHSFTLTVGPGISAGLARITRLPWRLFVALTLHTLGVAANPTSELPGVFKECDIQLSNIAVFLSVIGHCISQNWVKHVA